MSLNDTFASLTNERQVAYDDADEFAKKHNMFYFESSAKTGRNIDEVFNKLTIEIYKQ